MESKKRYADVDHLVRNRQDYEETLAIARKAGFYRVTEERTRDGWRYLVWPLPPGDRAPVLHRTRGAADRERDALNREADPLSTGRWWKPPKRKYTKRELAEWLPPESYWRK